MKGESSNSMKENLIEQQLRNISLGLPVRKEPKRPPTSLDYNRPAGGNRNRSPPPPEPRAVHVRFKALTINENGIEAVDVLVDDQAPVPEPPTAMRRLSTKTAICRQSVELAPGHQRARRRLRIPFSLIVNALKTDVTALGSGGGGDRFRFPPAGRW